MAFTIPKEINLLGFSNSTLSLILESIKINGVQCKIRIIKNIEVNDNLLYNPGLNLDIFHISEIDHNFDGKYFLTVVKPSTKIKVYNDFRKKFGLNYEDFFNLCHPSVIISSTAELKYGNFIDMGSVISTFIKIGNFVNISRAVSIGHHTVIDDFVSINPGTNIAGCCNIGYATTIGMGSSVFNGVTIGKESIIGGGSVVTRDIPDNVLAFGNPCKVIRQLP
jgi:sugar O-acyltransferase (sialic acid O-acetyltransferase NeuD family)